MNNGYSICLNEWIEDKRIKTELRLLLKISSLTAEKGYCYASNPYFAEYFETTEVTISKQIKKLEALNYLEIEYEKRGAEVLKRYIRLKKTLTDDYQKLKPTIKENFKENNTSINNTSNNKGVTSSDPGEDKKETAIKEINNTKNEILPVDIINFYKKNITDENGKVKEIKSMNALYEHKDFLQEILVGLTNYSKKLPTKKEYIVSLLNFIVDKKYKDYQESKTHSIFGEWTE